MCANRASTDLWEPWRSNPQGHPIIATGTDLERGMNVAAEGRDNTHDSLGIVIDGLIGKDFAKLVHDADLNDVLMVVKTDKNW